MRQRGHLRRESGRFAGRSCCMRGRASVGPGITNPPAAFGASGWSGEIGTMGRAARRRQPDLDNKPPLTSHSTADQAGAANRPPGIETPPAPVTASPQALRIVPASIPLPGDAGAAITAPRGARALRIVTGKQKTTPTTRKPSSPSPKPVGTDTLSVVTPTVPWLRLDTPSYVACQVLSATDPATDTPQPNILVNGDCLEALRHIPSNSIDLIFADPPYNLQLRATDLRRPNETAVDGVFDAWDAFASFEEYDRFTEKWVQECRRILSPQGSLWVIGSYHNIFRVGTRLQDAGFWLLNDVVWIKANPMPHFRGVRFTNAHETMIWAKKSETSTRTTFNYRAMKELNGGKQMRSDWYMPICGGRERLRDESGRKIHSTQKPASLLERIVLATSRPGDLVLDPFAGTGTTGLAAQRLGRRWLMIERDPGYCDAIEGRLGVASAAPIATIESKDTGNEAGKA